MTSLTIKALGACALSAALFHAPAHADWVTVSNSGGPLTPCNPKDPANGDAQSPSLTTCKVTGLPTAILPGYVQAAQVYTGSTEGANIIINSTTVGTRYDRVYCKGTVTGTIPNQTATCDFTAPVVIATRAQMSATVNNSARNTHCPVWRPSPDNFCFEINDYFRLIRGTNPTSAPAVGAVEVSTDIAYFMGTSSTSTNPNDALAYKYLEYAGKTFKPQVTAAKGGTTPTQIVTPPGNGNYANLAAAGDRNATRIMFQADTNVFDPDGGNSQWSPWLYVRQLCPNGYQNTATQPVRVYEYGEEGQFKQAIDSSGFSCKP